MAASKLRRMAITLRVAPGQRPPSVLLPAAAVPIHGGQRGEPSSSWSATPPLMASRRRQRRAAAAPILAYPTSRRHPRPSRSSASAARPPIKMMADAAVPSTAAAGRARHYLLPGCWARSPSAVLLLRAKLLLARVVPANVASSGWPSARLCGTRSPPPPHRNAESHGCCAQPEPARSARPAEMHIHCTYEPTMRSLKSYVKY